MIIGDRLKAVREAKKLSQGDIEKENGPLSRRPFVELVTGRGRRQMTIANLRLPLVLISLDPRHDAPASFFWPFNIQYVIFLARQFVVVDEKFL